MKFSRMITAVDSHAEGEAERVVIGGLPPVPGKTIMEKVRYMRENWDHLRTFLVHEPRGHVDMAASIITEPTVEEADVGVIYMSHGGYDTMCGHATIAICTVLVEMGLIAPQEPETEIVLDTQAGLVRAKVAVEDGTAKAVTIQNVPSFLYKSDVDVDVPTIGKVRLDIAFGGCQFIAILPAESVGLEIRPERVGDIASCGVKIWEAISEQVEAQHPEIPEMKGYSGLIFSGPPTHPRATLKNANVIPPGHVDRSPCGTGTSAKMAVLHARGELGLNEEFVHESILGTLYYGRLIEETQVGPYPAVVPTITGSAYITGIQQFVLDPRDPFPAGFHLGKKTNYGC
jgi:proline racemase